MRILHSRDDDASAGVASAKPRATDAEIRAYLEPNLCRCGTHMRILRAVKRAASMMTGPDASPSTHTPVPASAQVGTSADRQRCTARSTPLGKTRASRAVNDEEPIFTDFASSSSSRYGRVGAELFAGSPRGMDAGRRHGAGSKLPGSLGKNPSLDAWIRIDADGKVTAFTGKAELGQGIRTALTQVVAEELEVPFEQVSLVTADTSRTVDEGYTAGSHSVQDSGTALRNAAAQVREILIAEAARRLKIPAGQLHADTGAVIGPNSARITYAELVSANLLHAEAQPTSKLKDPTFFKVMDKPIQRVDIPGEGHRWGGLRSGYAPAGDVACAGGSAAELWRCSWRSSMSATSRR